MSSFKPISRSFLLRVSATLAAALLAAACGLGAENRDPAAGETAAGDLVADAVRAAAKAEVALVQAGVLKSAGMPDEPGEAQAVVAALLAYPQERIAVMNLDGALLQAALERGLLVLPIPHKGFLQVSGIVAGYDPAGPATKRVTSVTVGAGALDGKRRYKVAMPLSLAKGYLGYFRLFNGVPRQELDTTLSQALSAHLATKPPVPKPPQRLKPTTAR